MKKIIFIFTFSLVFLILLDLFFDNYTLTFPIQIKIKSPIQKREIIKKIIVANKNKEIRKQNKNSQISLYKNVSSSKLDDIIKKIKELESNSGRAPSGHHRFCQNLGMINEVGYGALNGFCFKDEEEQNQTLKNWFTKRLEVEKLTLEESLCFYNIGLKVKDCQYVKNFFSLKI